MYGGGPLRNRSGSAAFLCYHSVASAGPPFLTVSAELFERQLDAIARRGLRGGDLADLTALAEGRAIPSSVFLTFDDGFRDNYETVMPILRERGLSAFVFVLPGLVDEGAPLVWPEVADHARSYPETMRSVTWQMLEEMRDAGWEVGSHTLTHPHLPSLEGNALREELSESRRRIRERLGRCDTLAYPFGEWDEGVAQAAAECGYSFAFTLPSNSGQRQATRHSIPRVSIDRRDSGRRLESKLSPLGRRVHLSSLRTAWRRLRA